MKLLIGKQDYKKLGVYVIKNTVNDKFYIGSTSRGFHVRFAEHRKTLRRGDHHSSYLQRAYDKYGEEAFTFEILEIIPIEEVTDNKYITDVEQMWLDSHKPDYNICTIAGSSKGVTHTDETKLVMSQLKLGTKRSPESIEKQKEAWELRRELGIEKSYSEEGIAAIVKANKERVHTEESRAIRSEKMKGQESSFKGKTHTDETKAILSELVMGRPSPRKGATLSDETKALISASKIGKPSPKKGIPVSEAEAERLRTMGREQAEKNKGRKQTPEAIEKSVSKRRGVPLSDEAKANMSKAMKGRPAPNKGKPMSPEQKAKLSEAKKGVPVSPEQKALLAEMAKTSFLGKKHSPESIAKMKATKAAKREAKRLAQLIEDFSNAS